MLVLALSWRAQAIAVPVKTIVINEFQSSFSNQDATDWTIGGIKGPASGLKLVSTCGSTLLFGGAEWFIGDPNSPTFISKTFNLLPPHYQAQVSVQAIAIDTWTTEALMLRVDGTVLASVVPPAATLTLCGLAGLDQTVTVATAAFSHRTDSLKLDILSNAVLNTLSWGVYNLVITLTLCHPQCKECEGSTEFDCLACPSVSSVIPVISGNDVNLLCTCPNRIQYPRAKTCYNPPCFSCVSTCTAGYFLSGAAANYCDDCRAQCAACMGPANTNVDCSECELGYYPNAATAGISWCTACSPSCQSCSTIGISFCLSCTFPNFYYLGQCLPGPSCPSNTVASETTHRCQPCHLNCLTCFGTESTQCYLCSGSLLKQLDGLCVISCQPNFASGTACTLTCLSTEYYNLMSFSCLACNPVCLTCIDFTNCLLCSGINIFYKSTCVAACPPGSTPNAGATLCLACYSPCVTCSGPAFNQCLSCTRLSLVSGECVVACPAGSFVSGFGCVSCSTPCLSCTSPSACSNCQNGYLLHLNSSICVLAASCSTAQDLAMGACWTCPSGTTHFGGLCTTCFPGCLTCTGLKWFQCSSCPSDRGQSRLGSCLCNPGLYEDNGKCVNSSMLEGYTLAVFWLMVLSFALSLIHQTLFHNGAGCFVIVELMQLVSYLGFVSAPLPPSLQTLFDLLYSSHPSSWVKGGHLVMDYYQVPNMVPNLKFAARGKSGVFLVDMVGVVACCFVLLSVLAAFRILLKCANDSQWKCHLLLKWVWAKIYPSAIVRLVQLTVMQSVLAASLALYNVGQDKFSAICAGATLLLAGLVGVLSQTAEQWWLQPQIKYQGPLQSYHKSRGIYLPLLFKLPLPALMVFLMHSVLAQLALAALLSFALLAAQIFIPYRTIFSRFIRILQFSCLLLLSVFMLLQQEYMRLGWAAVASAVVLILTSVALFITQALMLMANFQFIKSQVCSVPAKFQVLLEVDSQHNPQLNSSGQELVPLHELSQSA